MTKSHHSPRRLTVTTRNVTAQPLQLIWLGSDPALDGLIRPGEDFTFSLEGRPSKLAFEIVTPLSPDGTTLTPADQGQLYTADGVWTFGQELGGGINAVRLNGAQPNAYKWAGSAMRVDHGGALYLQSGEDWWVWTPRRFTRCEAP